MGDHTSPDWAAKVKWIKVVDTTRLDPEGIPALCTYLQKRTGKKNAMSAADAAVAIRQWEAVKSTHPTNGEVNWEYRKLGVKKSFTSMKAVADDLGLIDHTTAAAPTAAAPTAGQPITGAKNKFCGLTAEPLNGLDTAQTSTASPSGKKQKTSAAASPMKVVIAKPEYLSEPAKGRADDGKAYIWLQITPPSSLPSGARAHRYTVSYKDDLGHQKTSDLTGNPTKSKAGSDEKDLIEVVDLEASSEYIFKVGCADGNGELVGKEVSSSQKTVKGSSFETLKQELKRGQDAIQKALEKFLETSTPSDEDEEVEVDDDENENPITNKANAMAEACESFLKRRSNLEDMRDAARHLNEFNELTSNIVKAKFEELKEIKKELHDICEAKAKALPDMLNDYAKDLKEAHNQSRVLAEAKMAYENADRTAAKALSSDVMEVVELDADPACVAAMVKKLNEAEKKLPDGCMLKDKVVELTTAVNRAQPWFSAHPKSLSRVETLAPYSSASNIRWTG